MDRLCCRLCSMLGMISDNKASSVVDGVRRESLRLMPKRKAVALVAWAASRTVPPSWSFLPTSNEKFTQSPTFVSFNHLSMMATNGSGDVNAQQTNGVHHTEVDPIWTSSRTARQIYALGEVEKVWLNILHGQTGQTYGHVGRILAVSCRWQQHQCRC